jgi:GT2 family glycosyltransferase
MIGKPAVSVVVPVFNAVGFLQESIEGILGQTFDDFELIIVNDGSTDESLDLISRIHDRRVRVITQTNQGQSSAINRGVSSATGYFIKIVDADDWLNAVHLESQVSSLIGFDGYISACRWGYFLNDFSVPDSRPEITDRHYTDSLEWIVDSLSHDEGMMGGWRWLIPRAVWDRAGGYDERLSLNNDFHASIAILLASSGVRFAPDAVYSYRKGQEGSLSGSVSRKAMESALLTTELGCDLLLKRENSPRIRHLCAIRFQRWAFDFFPQFPDLTAIAERRAAELGGASLPFPGGFVGKGLASVLGWKTVRRLQRIAECWGLTALRSLKRRFRTRLLR